MRKYLGFTLLEILIALFVFSIVATIISTVLHQVISIYTTTEKNAEHFRKFAWVLLMMDYEIEQTVNRSIVNAKGQPEGAFVGGVKGFSFTHSSAANVIDQQIGSHLVRSGYYIVDGVLYHYVWPALDQAPNAYPTKRPLLQGINKAKFEYFDDKNEGHAHWPLKEDSAKEGLPRAIRIELTLNDWGRLSQLYVLSQTAKKDSLPPPPPKP